MLAGDRDLFEFEYPCHSPDEHRWFLMRAAPFTDGGRRYVAVAHFDITERVEYERRLEESNQQLEEFASAVAHDLREPLRMVANYLDLLDRRYGNELDEEADEFVGFAVDGAERMRTVVCPAHYALDDDAVDLLFAEARSAGTLSVYLRRLDGTSIEVTLDDPSLLAPPSGE